MLDYTFKRCQQQCGSYNCAVFAVAWAYVISAGGDPCRIIFDETRIRDHFCLCLLKGEISDFPQLKFRENAIPSSKVESSHMLPLLECCYLPVTFSNMGTIKCVQCSETLVHKECIGKNKFICDACKRENGK